MSPEGRRACDALGDWLDRFQDVPIRELFSILMQATVQLANEFISRRTYLDACVTAWDSNFYAIAEECEETEGKAKAIDIWLN